MASESGIEAIEVERKYEVGPEVSLPGSGAFSRFGLVADPAETHALEAEYFDTRDGDLARAGLAMRVRRGGKDAGWHLKQRRADGVHELLWPPSDTVPEGLASEVRDRVGVTGRDLVVIARLSTSRTVVMLRDREGQEAVELADDRVFAEDQRAGRAEVVRRAWREWEAELMPGGDPSLLDLIEAPLLRAGALPSLSPAKIARATGRLVELARRAGASATEIGVLEALDASDQATARTLRG